MYRRKKDSYLSSCFFLIIFFLFLANLSSCTALANKSCNNKESFNPVIYSLTIYQKYISPIDGHRCRMHPSCSAYSKQAFQKHGFLKGWIMTCDRLLRCGRSELSFSYPIIKDGQKYCDDPLENNEIFNGNL